MKTRATTDSIADNNEEINKGIKEFGIFLTKSKWKLLGNNNDAEETFKIAIGNETYELEKPIGIGGCAVVFNVKAQPNIVIKVTQSADKTKAQNEIKIAKDIGIAQTSGSTHHQDPNDPCFYFMVMPKLEPFLLKEIQNPYDLAIRACLEVDQFHYGTTSKSKTQRAHQDIKPDNFLRDSKSGRVYLIDFAEATTELQDPYYRDQTKNRDGTPIYQAPLGSTLSNQEADILALMRILYLPNNFASAKNETSTSNEETQQAQYVFKNHDMTEPLKKLLDTSAVADGCLINQEGGQRHIPSALELAVELTKLELTNAGKPVLPEDIASTLIKSQQYDFFTEKNMVDIKKYLSIVDRLTAAVDPNNDNKKTRQIIAQSLINNQKLPTENSNKLLKSLKQAFWEGQVPQFFERSNQFGPFSLKNFAAQMLIKYYAQDIDKFKEGVQLFDGTSYLKTLCTSFGGDASKKNAEVKQIELFENKHFLEKKFSIGLFKPANEATGIQEILALYKNYKQHGDDDLFFEAAQAIANNRLRHRMSGLLRSNDAHNIYLAFSCSESLDEAIAKCKLPVTHSSP